MSEVTLYMYMSWRSTRTWAKSRLLAPFLPLSLSFALSFSLPFPPATTLPPPTHLLLSLSLARSFIANIPITKPQTPEQSPAELLWSKKCNSKKVMGFY